MKKYPKQSRVTLEKLARMTQDEFATIRKEMVTKDDLKPFLTKEDAKYFATKEDLRGLQDTIVDEVRKENQKAIQSNDKVITKLDTFLKENAAHTSLHKRIDDTLDHHEKRLRRVEQMVKAPE